MSLIVGSKGKQISDILIIGSGIVGSSCALALSKKGYSVRVLEKNKYNNNGTTSYSSGICRMYYTHIDSVKLSWDSYQFWYKDNWRNFIGYDDPGGMVSINECGALFLNTKNSNSFLKKTTSEMEKVGVPFSFLDFHETKNKLDKLDFSIENSFDPCLFEDERFGKPIDTPVYGSVYMPKSGYISDPSLANSNLQYGAKKRGAQFHFDEEVHKFLVDKKSNFGVYGVKTKKNIYYSPVVINCAGVYSKKINDMLYNNLDINNDSLDTKAMRQEVCYVEAPKNINVEKDGMIICDSDTGVHFRPETGNKFIVGNSEPPCDRFVYEDPDSIDTNFSDQYNQQLYRACLRIPTLPLFGGKKTGGIVSMYDVTEDWTPIYDKSNVNGYYLAIGTSGNQFKNAANIGNIMCNIIENKKKLNMTFFNDKINLNSFSRLRKPLPNSGSVFS